MASLGAVRCGPPSMTLLDTIKNAVSPSPYRYSEDDDETVQYLRRKTAESEEQARRLAAATEGRRPDPIADMIRRAQETS
jgi:hypothetical protein